MEHIPDFKQLYPQKMVNVELELAKNILKVIENNGNLVLLYKDNSGDIIFRNNELNKNMNCNLFDIIKNGQYFDFIKMYS